MVGGRDYTYLYRVTSSNLTQDLKDNGGRGGMITCIATHVTTSHSVCYIVEYNRRKTRRMVVIDVTTSHLLCVISLKYNQYRTRTIMVGGRELQ